MERYEKYKNSGIEWIGEIPEHWEINQIRRGLTLLTDYDANGSFSTIKDNVERVTNLENKYAWLVRATDLEQKTEIHKDSADLVWVSEETWNFLKKSFLIGGELLIAKRGEIGKVYLMPHVDFPSTLGPNMYLARLNKHVINPKFAYYFFSIEIGNKQLKIRNKSTTIGALYKDDFKDITFVFPTIIEQEKISNLLDRKTFEIDQIIANKQKLITFYEEEKQAIINQSVTKGLDPNAKMKDSGVEWLREIPEHWILKKLKHIMEVKDGTHDTPDYIMESENSIPLITSKDITSNCIDFSDCKHIAFEDYLIINNRSNVTFNDVIMPMIGTVGGAVIVDTNRPFSIKNVALFKTSEINCNVKYIKFFIDSEVIKKQFEIESRGGVQNFVSLSLLRNLFAFDIPKIEQDAIVTYIENESKNINLLIDKFNKQIDLLQEYRTTLISEVVTGKIKVLN